jgi:diguanylate cyclase (GGDEF)-like protein/PAS domain S-box-containing protein
MISHAYISATYDPSLVAISVVIAIFASYAALDLGGRITVAQNKARIFWITGGAISMGLGIWAMHYVGMLAFHMRMQTLYHVPTVVYSLLAAIVASAIALVTVGRRRMETWQVIVSGVFMGIGIASMHYIGMAAMRLPARIEYHRGLVTLSVALAIGISMVALLLTFKARNEKHVTRRKVISALVMGSAIPVMHYTGMWAARFVPSDTPVDVTNSISMSMVGAVVITSSILLLLTLVTLAAFLDRLWSAQKSAADEAKKGEAYLQKLADAIPQMIFTAGPNGKLDFSNQRWFEYTGTIPKRIEDGVTWLHVMHPDDVPRCTQQWQQAIRSGQPYEAECRFQRGSDSTYRWHLARAVPLRGESEEIVKWFGSCTDIEDQKRNQEELESQVRQRTEDLVEANSRLTREMQERERTQQQLDRKTQSLVVELKDQSKNNALLADMGQLLQTCNDVSEALTVVLGFAPRMFPNLRGAIILLNASKSVLEVVGQWANCRLESQIFDPDDCWALRTGRRYTREFAMQSVPCPHAKSLESSYLCIPIQAQGEALGILHFQSDVADHHISDAEVSLAGTFAEQTGLAIANIRLRDALRKQSIRDSLTGLFNRRYLEETLERELHRAARGNQPLGVIMIDLDHFKGFNDTFGHEAGDIVLHEIGTFLLKHTRTEDIACRYGGEELVVILPNADAEGTAMRADQIRTAAQDLVLTSKGQALGTITLSAGIAAFPAHGTSPSQLMAAADAALYRAKKNGRNCVFGPEGKVMNSSSPAQKSAKASS